MSSAIKSIQRGTAASSGDVTITPVNTNKTKVNSFSKGSAGYVAGRGDVTLAPASSVGIKSRNTYDYLGVDCSWPNYSGAFSGGTTDLTAAVYGAILKDATTITCSGACEWEVVEYA